MSALDHAIAGLAHGGGLAVALAIGLLLGLRHATDPDHLTAVSTLVMGDGRSGRRRAARLGLAWGSGHALTLVAFGLPLVLFKHALPKGVERGAELAVGVLIVALALRLLVRWKRGYLHVHPHRHGDRWHAHPHAHEQEAHDPAHAHDHAHPEALGRTPLAAFGIGLLHGLGGSAGVGLLVVGAIPGRAAAVGALLLLALGCAISMALLSAGLGGALGRAARGRSLAALAPGMGTLALVFGCWYALAAAAVL